MTIAGILALLKRLSWDWIISACVIGAAVFYIYQRGKADEAQGNRIAALEASAKAEKEARTRDVAGLTTLVAGLSAAKSATAADQAILERTIDVRNPQPVSDSLRAFLSCLRANDTASTLPCATPSAGGTAKPNAPATR